MIATNRGRHYHTYACIRNCDKRICIRFYDTVISIKGVISGRQYQILRFENVKDSGTITGYDQKSEHDGHVLGVVSSKSCMTD